MPPKVTMPPKVDPVGGRLFIKRKLNQADDALRTVEKIALELGDDKLAEKVGFAIAALSDAESYM